ASLTVLPSTAFAIGVGVGFWVAFDVGFWVGFGVGGVFEQLYALASRSQAKEDAGAKSRDRHRRLVQKGDAPLNEPVHEPSQIVHLERDVVDHTSLSSACPVVDQLEPCVANANKRQLLASEPQSRAQSETKDAFVKRDRPRKIRDVHPRVMQPDNQHAHGCSAASQL